MKTKLASSKKAKAPKMPERKFLKEDLDALRSFKYGDKVRILRAGIMFDKRMTGEKWILKVLLSSGVILTSFHRIEERAKMRMRQIEKQIEGAK